MTANLFELLARSIVDPQKTAIATQGGERVSYAELIAAAGRLANVLVDRGVKPGDRVAVQVEKSVPALVLYLATVRAGAVYLPLNSAYTLAELEYFIGDAEPRLVVCDPAKRESVGVLTTKVGGAVETLDPKGRGTLMEAAAAASPAFETVKRAGDDIAAILYTSGTTGRSKGAMLTHDNLVSNALALKEIWRFTADDVLIHALPIYHTHGLFVATNVAFFAGASMTFLPKFDADSVLALMPHSTALMGIPTFYTRLLSHPGLTAHATSRMRLFVSGSAPLLAETHREWSARTGHAILERYGMTETSINTSNPYDGDRMPGAVGLPLPGVSIRICDPEAGTELARDAVGMIEVKGPNVFKGYWRMPEKTAAEHRPDGFFITGDLGKIDERGYVHILGRDKDLIITGGFNVYPKEIEAEIDAIPGVTESAVIGVPHQDFGEGVTAVVVPTKTAAVDERSIKEALEGRLAKFKLPKRVVFLDALPRNAMGKVQKSVLREQFADLYTVSASRAQSAAHDAGHVPKLEEGLAMLRGEAKRIRGGTGLSPSELAEVRQRERLPSLIEDRQVRQVYDSKIEFLTLALEADLAGRCLRTTFATLDADAAISAATQELAPWRDLPGGDHVFDKKELSDTLAALLRRMGKRVTTVAEAATVLVLRGLEVVARETTSEHERNESHQLGSAATRLRDTQKQLLSRLPDIAAHVEGKPTFDGAMYGLFGFVDVRLPPCCASVCATCPYLLGVGRPSAKETSTTEMTDAAVSGLAYYRAVAQLTPILPREAFTTPRSPNELRLMLARIGGY